jgi:undecaprenyl-diphosphatase
MEALNDSLFLLINASSSPPPAVLVAARALAEGVIWLIPLGLVWGWLRGSRDLRATLLRAALAGLIALGANQLIGLVWYHPRPFEIGLGHAWLVHSRDSSFPSDHVTLLWSVALGLALRRHTRTAGMTLGLAGIAVAWARIYLGVHFPFDMAGAAVVAVAAVAVASSVPTPAIDSLLRALSTAHRVLFAPLIARGWVKP